MSNGSSTQEESVSNGSSTQEGSASETPSSPAPEVSAPEPVAQCPQCEITSETVVSQPPDRARRNIGVGERVRLTFSLGNANWEITAGRGRLSSRTGTTVIFIAPGTAQGVTVSATGGGCTAIIDLTIIAPTDVRMTRRRTLHEQNTHKIGMVTRIYFLPDTVNFHRIEYLEDEVNCRATGVYACINNSGHFPAATPFSATTRVIAGYGTRINADDEIRSGFCNWGRVQGDGQISWMIPWKYRVRGWTNYHRIKRIRQVCTSTAAGRLRARKARTSASANYADPGTW